MASFCYLEDFIEAGGLMGSGEFGCMENEFRGTSSKTKNTHRQGEKIRMHYQGEEK